MAILDDFRLDGKLAVVTGSSQGIGQGMAKALAEAGADIVNFSLALPDGATDETQSIIEGLGRRYEFFPTDFSDRQQLYASVNAAKEKYGTPDILVNNAGMIARAPIAEHPDEYWDKVIEVNLSSQFVITREFGKDMVERGSGKVVFTASLLSFQGGITVPGYAASKSGVARLIMAFANEWASKGVNVNGLAPGYIATENTSALRADPARSKAILERIPAGRWGTPADFGGPCVFLASPASDYMHGSIVTVDGGWMGR
jgi:2-deoxy-D-gluconate 3-dehydrogenase